MKFDIRTEKHQVIQHLVEVVHLVTSVAQMTVEPSGPIFRLQLGHVTKARVPQPVELNLGVKLSLVSVVDLVVGLESAFLRINKWNPVPPLYSL